MTQQPDHQPPLTEATLAVDGAEHGITKKGLSAGSVGLIGAIVIGISCIAPAYTLTAALGPTVSEVGVQVPAIILVGFIPMLLVAFGYRELNRRMPDSGTSFTWATRAFGPWIGWLAGWGLVAATILVLSNLAGIAVDFLFLLISQVTGNPEIADLAANPLINVTVCLLFVARGDMGVVPRHADHAEAAVLARRLPGARARALRGRRPRRGRQRQRLRRHGDRAVLVQPVRGRVVLARSPRVSRSRSSSSGAGTSPSP